ncbi:hypothetical protein [Muricoccus radiodurans]|uniref:hypothetical protein n=1 Tax=Muricoccus radiodurans TaxID=2231721 RepID=UPI003CF7321A
MNGRQFPAAVVERAAEIDSDSLANFINKSPLDLCSRSPGRGRARQFCLVDVYQLAFLARLVRITSRVESAARCLNFMLWQTSISDTMRGVADKVQGKEASWLDRLAIAAAEPFDADAARRSYCEDVRRASPLYHYRNENDPFFIYSDIAGRSFQAGPNPALTNPRYQGGILLNATFLLNSVDQTLAEHIKRLEDERG